MLQHGACQQQNKRTSDTAQWLEQSQDSLLCLSFRVLRKKELERGQVTEFEFGLLACFCKLYRHRRCCTDPKRRSTRAHAASGCKPEFSHGSGASAHA